MYNTFAFFRKETGDGPKRRAVAKNGDCNVSYTRIAEHRKKFVQDFFTTLVDVKWTWMLLVFALSFLLSWLGFGLLWWIIAFTHGDLYEENLPKNQQKTGWSPCVTQINSFASCFLFSIETQQTIGYGSRTITEECPQAMVLLYLQCIAGVAIQALMVGIIFAKTVRPSENAHSIIFSNSAVICHRDGYLYLMFRIGNMRKSHIVGAKMKAQLIRTKITNEGEKLHQYQTELPIATDDRTDHLFLIWPLLIAHKIDENSPLLGLTASEVRQDLCEIVVMVEGTIESTGRSTQSRTSYLLSEILWGQQFVPIVTYNAKRRKYHVDYSKFDDTVSADTPSTAGTDLIDFYSLQEREGMD
ncbi:ATP-sensitive inward rectifier potassium channel 12-like [Photinus pyralis]|uniref:ATP-sensitive inward rectifier potassium channel 12-like n=1 Tax=Photinus pyralis TaxID=7054 RepID=UPI0012676037|nr:ATP-sensitive inward rectifier potassium channel 12-like [Photinus pyralis]